MIQPNELRIGNWVNIQGEFDSKIHSIENGRLWCKDGDQMISSTVFKFQPIPLTPEVLEKCGFRNYEGTKWDTDVMLIIKNGEGYLYLANQRHVNIYYLHQLQNLYFALTGEELNYTP